MNFFNWLSRLIEDERFSPDAKTLVGILLSICLGFCLIYSVFAPRPLTIDTTLLTSITALAAGCLGSISLDKFITGKQDPTPPTPPVENKST